MIECEVEIDAEWQVVSAAEAAQHADKRRRCLGCRGPIKTYPLKEGKINVEHIRAHKGCQLSSYNFDGHSTKHPDAIE